MEVIDEFLNLGSDLNDYWDPLEGEQAAKEATRSEDGGHHPEDPTMATQTPASVGRLYFSSVDYCLFAAMLVLSALIGIYFAFLSKRKQNTTAEYLMGGRNMRIAPVAMSLTASYISGITLLGLPGEVYRYGTQFSTLCFGAVFAGICAGVFFIPVFYQLKLNTSYEYLGMRFDRKVQALGSFMFVLTYMLYIPVVIYVPAIAINQVTGVNIHLITPIVCLVCIFYTALGGMKAVVWTDALQIIVMFVSLFTIVVVGNNAAGGFETIWKRNNDTGRIDFFNLDLDLTTRLTFWNTVIGLSFSFIYSFSVNQGMVQRFLAMSTLTRARILLLLSIGGICALIGISTYIGLQIFAKYHDCDQLSNKVVGELDQLLPFFVMDVAGTLTGLPGLFMAGVFSAALSSMSTGLNSMSGVIYEDFIIPYLKVKPTEERSSFVMKVICAVLGVLCVGMVFVVENLEGVVQTSWALEGISSGPILAMFVLGMFNPWANSSVSSIVMVVIVITAGIISLSAKMKLVLWLLYRGAFVGGIVGLVVMGVICIANQVAISTGILQFPRKPVSVKGCTFPSNVTDYSAMEASIIAPNYLVTVFEMNATSSILEMLEVENILFLFRISYTWYCVIGLLISVVVGTIVSAITGLMNLNEVQLEHLTPAIRPLFSHRCKSTDRNHTVMLNEQSNATHESGEKSTT